MKRSLTLLIVIMLGQIPFTVHAQPEPGIAVKGGLNAASHDEDTRFNRYGFAGGIAGYLHWIFGARFALASQIDLYYTPRGAKVISGGEYLGQVRQHYFDIMVTARPEVRLGPASIYLLLGGGVNFLMSANREVEASGTKEDITDALHRIDVALLAGVGFALHTPRQKMGPFRLSTVFLEARYDRGLIDTSIDGGLQNRTASLMIGLSFALGDGAEDVTSASPSAQRDPQSPTAAAGPSR
ncbi:MAG TPA: outer membrane beta-barrel protein [Kofleriaceae bacterium]|nr:outer membrane beta-barrel protein [Kofleriaceae bacterium]